MRRETQQNATNLKSHLSRFHKEEARIIEAQDGGKEGASMMYAVAKSKQPKQSMLTSCFAKKSHG